MYFDFHAFFIILLIGLLTLFIIYYFKTPKPSLYISDISSYYVSRPSLKQRLSNSPKIFLGIALFLFGCAYLDPHQYLPKKKDSSKSHSQIPTEGLAIYLTLDTSQSMLEQLSATLLSGEVQSISKIEVLKEVTTQFVKGNSKENLKGRQEDLIGIVTFSRGAHVLSPLTLDHQNIIKLLENLKVNTDENERGTALGYALFKTANLIASTRYFSQQENSLEEPAYTIKNAIIVLVTDGVPEINPQDYTDPLRSIEFDEAVNYVKDLGIKLYLIDIDPKINTKAYADYRKYFKILTEMTGGKFFYLNSTQNLVDIYQEIDRLEKSPLPMHFFNLDNMPHLYQRISYYIPLIIIGMSFLLGYILLETLILKKVP